MPPTIPPLLLERALLQEYSQSELQALRERFGPSFDQALEALKSQDQDFKQSPDFEIELQQIKDRLAKQPRQTSRPFWTFAPALAAVTALVAVVWSAAPEGPELKKGRLALNDSSSESSDVRLKGLNSHLTLHRKLSQGKEQLAPKSVAKAGDVIQLSYVAAKAKHGVIFSIDGSGQVTRHFPLSAQGSSALLAGGAKPLGQAYELDAAPDFERFFFVSVDQEQAPANFVATVMQKAQDFAAGPRLNVKEGTMKLPKSWYQSSFLLRKEPGT